MSKHRLNPRASTWLMIDSADTPLHSGVLAIFELPRSAGPGYITDLAADLRAETSTAAPWDWVLGAPLAPGLPPRLARNQAVELDYHFRHSALPSPGGERELGVLISRLHSNWLDHSRPLWEYHLIEGLENNRFAVYLKIHRALVDDINAVPLFIDHLASSARKRGLAPVWSRPIGEPATPAQTPLDEVLSVVVSAGRAGIGLVRAAFERGPVGSMLLPNRAPRSTLNRQISHSRRFATWQLELARIEQLAAVTDSTVNEVLSFLCGSSLRRFFKEYNALPDESLVGFVPVSMRERGEQNPGGAVAAIRIELGTHIGNPRARLEAVKASIQSVRRDRESLPETAATSYALMRAAPVLASQLKGIGRLVPPVFNLRVSMTEAPAKPVYFNGARLQAIYPVNTLLQFSALSIDCVGYAGVLNIGFTGARETLPHLQRLAVYLGKAVEDLEAMTYQQEAS